MSHSHFDPQPILDFVARRVSDGALAGEALEAIMPVLHGLVDRGFAFKPIRKQDLEPIRAAIEKLLGFTVREVRAFALDELIRREAGESVAAGTARVQKTIDRLKEDHLEFDDLLDVIRPFTNIYITEEVEDDLDAAFAESLEQVKPPEDPLLEAAIAGHAQTLIWTQMPALLAAACGDRLLFNRFTPFLPWLSRCIPVGALILEPGVITIITASAPH